MASIHVIYDPYDKIADNPDLRDRTKIKIARLSVDENADREHLEGLVVALATLLMKEVWGD